MSCLVTLAPISTPSVALIMLVAVLGHFVTKRKKLRGRYNSPRYHYRQGVLKLAMMNNGKQLRNPPSS